MRTLAKLSLLALALTPAGCGGDPAPVTDPSKLPPVSDADKKEVRQADDRLEDEEHSNPTKGTRGAPARK